MSLRSQLLKASQALGMSVGLSLACTAAQAGYFQWEAVELPAASGASCGNGSPYRFFVNRTPFTSKTVVMFEGGGACWDHATCFGLGTATPGPFGKAELLARINAVMRRADAAGAGALPGAGRAPLTAGSLTIDPGRVEARVGETVTTASDPAPDAGHFTQASMDEPAAFDSRTL